ncbi:MAG: hypothetical protein AAGE52_40675 [Myxococcota bacterium]
MQGRLRDVFHRTAFLCAQPLFALGLVACTVSDGLLENRACPCIDGYACVDGICVRGDASDARIPDAAQDAGVDAAVDLPTTCWQRVEGCDWSTAGSFTFIAAGTVVDVASSVRNVSLSPDGCELLFTLPGGSGRADFWHAQRPDAASSFGEPEPIEELNGPGRFNGKVTVAANGLELFFTSAIEGASSLIYRSERSSLDGEWSIGDLVDPLNAAGVETFDVSLAPTGRRIFFSRQVLAMDQELLVAERSSDDAPFGPPAVVEELSQRGLPEAEPVVTADERVMTYIVPPAVAADRQLNYATRPDRDAPWVPRGTVPGEVLAIAGELEGIVSPDGCELFLVRSDGDAQRLIYESVE